jgi:hypothetical protein
MFSAMPIPILTQDGGHGTYTPNIPRPPIIPPVDSDPWKICPECMGKATCSKCDGTGTKGGFWGSKDCKRCDGTGVCQTCRGLGYI